ncbi:MAG: response regulator, partial [Burkholderiaceae bacterium]|nr:response regulator [Burkholderiaceae bacterium]
GDVYKRQILMDVVMPGQNGFQLTRAISKDPATANIPIIMCTSKNQETDRVWAMRQGARDYVTKPVNADELLAKIRAL